MRGAARNTTNPDVEINMQLVASLGVTLNPRLKRFLACVTAEEVLKGLAAYYYTLEIKQTGVESIPGFIIDSIRNNYIEDTKMWMDSTEPTRKFILLAAGAMGMGMSLDGGFLMAMDTGKLVVVGENSDRSSFHLDRIIELLDKAGYAETLKIMLDSYRNLT